MAKIKEMFNLVKGTLQSSKCTPGEYNFITASKDWKTHNDFEYNCEALIFAAAASGSLGRTHYVNGKFISSDLCFIITAKDEKKFPIDLKFYYIIFNTLKEDIVKNTKAGTSKEAIGLKALGEYELPYIDIDKQREISAKFNYTTEISESFGEEITHQLNLIKNLRQAFLREAMQGFLVSNETSDNKTGEDLLTEIQAEKAQLVKEKKIKKSKPLAPITEEEIPFDIPENWTWCRLGEIVENIKYGTSKSSDYDLKRNSKILRIPNISSGILNNEDLKFTNLESKEIEDLSLRKNDILTIRSNGSKFLVGLFVEVGEEFERYCYAGYLIRLRFLSDFINSSFITYSSKTTYFRNLIEKPLRTTVGINNINTEELSNLIIPLPSLEIQERIVAKLDELMRYCDALEEQVKQSQQTNELLLQQVLREDLGDKKQKAVNKEIGVSINKYVEVETNYDALVAETFGEYLPKKVNNINDTNKELAALVYLMNNGLGANYGNVAFQKAVYNSSVITPNLYSKKHDFVNHNYGTFSKELANDLNHNPYLTTIKIGSKEVYEIEPSKKNEILNVLSSAENKNFVSSVNKLIDLYRLPFINKETNKMELLNTVLKIYSDLKTIDIEIIYQAMKDWKIKQTGFNTKAEKFSKEDTAMMIELLQNNGII